MIKICTFKEILTSKVDIVVREMSESSSLEEGEIKQQSRRRQRTRKEKGGGNGRSGNGRPKKKADSSEEELSKCSHCGKTTDEPGNWPNCAFDHNLGRNWQEEMTQHFVCGTCIDGFCGSCHAFFCANCMSSSGDGKLCKDCE